jgi:hypothetical protein
LKDQNEVENFYLKSGYVRFEKVTTSVFAEFAKVKLSIWNSTDLENGLMTLDVRYGVEIVREQQRYKVFVKSDAKDSEGTHAVFSTNIDTCAMAKGVWTTGLHRVIMQNFIDSLQTNYSCPFPANSRIFALNFTITDKYFPPLTDETFLRAENNVYGMLRGQKKWTHLYLMNLYMRVKKSLFKASS